MFRALVLRGKNSISLEQVKDDFLPEAEVCITVEYSSVNYKDALAITGKGDIARNFPLIPGIDLVGTVSSSSSSRFSVGDRVVLNGGGAGEKFHGGLAERAAVKADSVIKVPQQLSQHDAAAIGTAGFTAMIGVLSLEKHGIKPEDGPILVTGAVGGVGSFAVALLASRGYQVSASTGRAATESAYLESLGATEIIDRHHFVQQGKALQQQRWAAVLDSIGSHTLANALAQTRYGGIVVACGLVQGADLPTTVLPFILRSLSLVGANSVDASLALREQAWSALAAELSPKLLTSLSTTIPLADAVTAARKILSGHSRGRIVVDTRQR